MTLLPTPLMSLDDTTLDQLAAQVRAEPPLPLEEVDRLLVEARRPGHNGRQREALVVHHMNVALDAALAGGGPDDDIAELFQEAGVALVEAVAEYVGGDGDAAGLVPHLRRAADAQVVAVTSHERERRQADEALLRDTRVLDLAQVSLEARLGRPATPEELAEVLQWPVDKVNRLATILEDARRLHDETLIPFLDDVDDV